MSSAKGNNKQAYIHPYELQKRAQCAKNKQKFDELGLLKSIQDLRQENQPQKRLKKTQETREVAANNHYLRPRPERTNADIAIANEGTADCETIGDFLSDDEDMHSSAKKKRKGGRKHIKMRDIIKEPGSMPMPKIKIELNDDGQPIGKTYRKLSSVLGVLIRTTLPIACSDWRLVDAGSKMKLWNDIKDQFDIDDKARDWVMDSAVAKWRQYKAYLKRKFFDETLSNEEMKNLHGHMLDEDQLDSLLKYWRSPESQGLSQRGKCNRSKLKFLHTSGSVSYAATAHKLGQQLGRPPRRDEIYIKIHTRKNGVPLVPAAPTIEELKEVVQNYPELLDRTIQQGDAFATVCGFKEPKGRVRCLGLGPTPQDIRTPGLKAYTSTRLQIEVLARQQVENENLVLRQQILEMQDREDKRMARELQNVETTSHHGSNSRQQMSPRLDEFGEANQHVQGEEDGCAENNIYSEEANDEANKQAAASPAMNITASNQQDVAVASSPTASPRNDVQKFSKHALPGNEVILFAMSSDEKVAKATVVSANPNNKIDGVALGKRFCEVNVDVVLKRDTLVPRPYADIKTVGDALNMPIAWPYNRLKRCSQRVAGSQRSSQGAVGSSQRR